MDTISIILFTLGAIGIVLFLIIIFFILKNNWYKSSYELLIKKYNKLALEDFERKNLICEHIGANNQKYLSIMNLFNEFGTIFEEELSIVKENIYKLNSCIKNYDWSNYRKLYKITNDDMKNLSESLDKLNDLYINILDYRNYVGGVFVDYCEYSGKLISFYEKNIDTAYDNENIKQLIVNIKTHSTNVEHLIDKMDLNKLMIILNNYNKNYFQLFELINNIYIHDKQKKYITFAIKEIEELVSKNSKIIANENERQAYKKLTILKKSEATLNKKISNNDFKYVDNIIKDIIKDIINIKKSLNVNFTSNDFLSNNISTIHTIIQMFLNENNKFYGFLNKINHNFSTINTIIDNVTKLKNDLSTISKNATFFYKKDKILKNNSAHELVKETKKIIVSIENWTNEFNYLISETRNEYIYFKEIIKEISSSKLFLYQMLAFILKNRINNKKQHQNIVKDIKDISSHLTQFEKDFNTNYDLSIINEYDKFIEMKIKMKDISKIINFFYIKKKYCERLIYYANVLTFNQIIEIDTTQATNLYNENKYKECLILILKQLKNVRHRNEYIHWQ